MPLNLFATVAGEFTLRCDAKTEALCAAFGVAFLQVECAQFALGTLRAFYVCLKRNEVTLIALDRNEIRR